MDDVKTKLKSKEGGTIGYGESGWFELMLKGEDKQEMWWHRWPLQTWTLSLWCTKQVCEWIGEPNLKQSINYLKNSCLKLQLLGFEIF